MTFSDLSQMTWPDRVKALRDRLGLSQAALAERMNVRRATVSEWENGHTEPQGAAVRLIEILERDRLTPTHPKEEG